MTDYAAILGRPAPLPVYADHLRARRVLITGAGGSIGSELAAIVARSAPERLILVERSENALFTVDRLVAERCPHIPRLPVLLDVVDEAPTARLLARTRPHVVFHAAAYKHVPLMEENPAEAARNNLGGTKSIADAAAECGAERLVFISTDKAANPVSVMGMTKLLAEKYLAGMDRGATLAAIVRFGNVLGSSCSVLPIWEAQAAVGGPLTVTDERMTRYFMSIPEAAGLVTRVAGMEQDRGEVPVYVLDMGRPVRVLDLARRFIAGRPLDIRITGARPGEKIHEDLAHSGAHLSPTPEPGILKLIMGTTPCPPSSTPSASTTKPSRAPIPSTSKPARSKRPRLTENKDSSRASSR